MDNLNSQQTLNRTYLNYYNEPNPTSSTNSGRTTSFNQHLTTGPHSSNTKGRTTDPSQCDRCVALAQLELGIREIKKNTEQSGDVALALKSVSELMPPMKELMLIVEQGYEGQVQSL